MDRPWLAMSQRLSSQHLLTWQSNLNRLLYQDLNNWVSDDLLISDSNSRINQIHSITSLMTIYIGIPPRFELKSAIAPPPTTKTTKDTNAKSARGSAKGDLRKSAKAKWQDTHENGLWHLVLYIYWQYKFTGFPFDFHHTCFPYQRHFWISPSSLEWPFYSCQAWVWQWQPKSHIISWWASDMFLMQCTPIFMHWKLT